MNDRLFVAALRVLPKNALSRAAGALARWRAPALLLRAAIRAFAARYGVDLGDYPPLGSYATFGEFFARPLLHPGLRPVAPGERVAVSPVDGTVSAAGAADSGRLLQAKGILYPLAALLGDPALAARFADGPYLTLYLSPRDYHRIHFPLGGRVTGFRYLPGRLWPVNASAVRTVPALYGVNERLVTLLDTPVGSCALVAVGATVVGRVRATYDPAVPLTNRAGAKGQAREYKVPIPFEKGEELGVFEMGSTVVLVFEPGRLRLAERLGPGARVRMGEEIGRGE